MKNRESNMELLRIVSMLLVMVVHANFRALPYPTQAEALEEPVSSLLRFGTESLSIICVNTFVLLSGWYGIRFKMNRLLEFLFQVFFFSLLCMSFVYFFDKDSSINLRRAVNTFLMTGKWNYWFVKSYLCLYLFSPIINTFVENCTRKQFFGVLCIFLPFYFIYGYITRGAPWFDNGYSGFSFIVIYLIARYISIYRPSFSQYSKWIDLSLYIVFAVINTIIAFIATRYGHIGTAHKVYQYTSPIVIVQAIFFLLFFSKLHLKNHFINWVGISCFSIYLVHSNSYIAGPYYDSIIKGWFYGIHSTTMFLLKTALFISCIFILSICIDKIRIRLWSIVYNTYERIFK